MTEINIPDMHIQEIRQLIQDGYIKRVFGHSSVNEFIMYAIEGEVEAEKDMAHMIDYKK